MNHTPRMQVSAELAGLVIQRAIVMPVSEAGFRLPDIGHDFVGESALAIVDDAFDQGSGHVLDVGDDVQFASPFEEAAVVIIGGNVHPGPAEWKHRVIEIEDIWIMLVDEIA